MQSILRGLALRPGSINNSSPPSHLEVYAHQISIMDSERVYRFFMFISS